MLGGEGRRDGLGGAPLPTSPPEPTTLRCSAGAQGGIGGDCRHKSGVGAPTFSKRETLLAFRAAASSTKGGPRPKISRSSSLFCRSRSLLAPISTGPAPLVQPPSPYLEVVADAGAQHLFEGLVGPLACPAVQVHALQAKSDGFLLVLPTLSRERGISNNLGVSPVRPPALTERGESPGN